MPFTDYSAYPQPQTTLLYAGAAEVQSVTSAMVTWARLVMIYHAPGHGGGFCRRQTPEQRLQIAHGSLFAVNTYSEAKLHLRDAMTWFVVIEIYFSNINIMKHL